VTAQALFRVEVDGTAISVPKGDDIASLGVGFFCMGIGPANLHIDGFQVQSVFVHEDGSTHGEHFIALDLQPKQQVGVEPARLFLRCAAARRTPPR
jgi:hypothetical protein